MIKKTILIILLSLIVNGFVLAQDTELEYPRVGGKEVGESLGSYLNYVFTFAIALAGVIAFAALIYGGFKYLTSGGNPATMASGRNQMLGAIIGLILLLGSYIILNTINPDLVNLPWAREKPKEGICFYEESNAQGKRWCFSKNSKSVPNNLEAKSVEFESSPNKLPAIFIFDQEDYQGSSQIVFNGEDLPGTITPPASFFLYWQEYGARLYTGAGENLENLLNFEDFPDQPYQVYKTNSASLGDYNGRVRSIDFAAPCHQENGTWIRNVNYAAILHSETDFEGECGIVFGMEFDNPSGGEIQTGICTWGMPNLDEGSRDSYVHPDSFGNDSAHSITLFNYNNQKPETGRITFYDRPNQAGDHFTVEADDFNPHGEVGYYWRTNIDNYPIQGNINGAQVEEGKAEEDNGEMEEIMSFKIEGRFMVVLTQEEDFDSYCEVFKRSAASLEGHYVIHEPWDARVRSIMIIPLREPVDTS